MQLFLFVLFESRMARKRKSEAWKEVSLVTWIRQRSKKSLNIVLWKSSRVFCTFCIRNALRKTWRKARDSKRDLFPGWGSVSGATVQTVRDAAPVKPGPLSCSERITWVAGARAWHRTRSLGPCVCPRGNNKGVKFRNEKWCRPPLLESQPSSARTKRCLFRLSHL